MKKKINVEGVADCIKGRVYPLESTPQLFNKICNLYPNREALVFEGKRYTWNELRLSSERMARGLWQLGIKKGDHVGLLMGNCVEWMLCYFGLIKLGAVIVPLNTRVKTFELEFMLNNSDISTLIIEGQILNMNYKEMMYELCPELKNSYQGMLNSKKIPLLRNVISLTQDDSTMPGTFNLNDIYKAGVQTFSLTDPIPHIEAEVKPHDLWAIIYTSGTTGNPKGCMHTQYAYSVASRSCAEAYKLTLDDRILHTIPLFHTFGLNLFIGIALVSGCTMVLMRYFRPEEALKLVEEEKITWISSVPTVFYMMAQHPDIKKYDTSKWNLRGVSSGGGDVTEKLVDICLNVLKAKEFGQNHGMTEMIGNDAVVTGIDPKLAAECSVCTPDLQLKMTDLENHETLPFGQEGEQTWKGYRVTRGYYKMPKETAKAFTEDGWFLSGDLGILKNDRGYWKHTGRSKDIYIVGGENVAPKEVENFLLTNPKIQNIYVAGVPDKRLQEVGMAFVELVEGETLTEEELIAFCKDKIANYKVPRWVKFMEPDEFPTTSTGKIQKFKLTEIGIQELKRRGVDM